MAEDRDALRISGQRNDPFFFFFKFRFFVSSGQFGMRMMLFAHSFNHKRDSPYRKIINTLNGTALAWESLRYRKISA